MIVNGKTFNPKPFKSYFKSVTKLLNQYKHSVIQKNRSYTQSPGKYKFPTLTQIFWG